MFTMTKPLSGILRSIKASRKGIAKWWLTMSDQEQRAVVLRGATISGCAFAACVLLPTIGVRYEGERQAAQFRAEANALAKADAPTEAVLENANAASLLEHNWLRSVGHSVERSPRASLSRYAMHARDDDAVATVITDHIDSSDNAELISAEYDCLTKAVYYEAGFESSEGKLGVAEVIMNRVADHRYPNTVCEVVFQGATRTTGCQFTFTCDGALGRKPDEAKWEEAKTVAAHVMMDLNERRTGAATHYHATYVDPIWNVGLVRTNKIGAHIFYRFPRGSEWAKARNAVAKKRAYRARVASYQANGYGVAPALAEREAVNALQLRDNTLSPAP